MLTTYDADALSNNATFFRYVIILDQALSIHYS